VRPNDPRFNIAAFIGVGVLLLAGLVLFARYPSLLNRGRRYEAVFNSVAGLSVGDQVRYGGLLVGVVTTMDLDDDSPTRIRVKFRVRRKTPVNTDTKASISQVGLLGEPYLDLRAGRPGAPPLDAGSTLPSDDNQSFQDAMNQLSRFFERTDTLFGALDEVAGGKPFERMERTLSRVEELVVTTTTGSARVLGQLDSAGIQLSRVLSRTDRLIARLDTTVETAGPELATAQREMVSALRDVRTLVSDVRDALNSGGGVEQVMRDVQTVSQNLARLTERVEQDPLNVLKRRAVTPKPAGPPARP